jgi:hypothetical protein
MKKINKKYFIILFLIIFCIGTFFTYKSINAQEYNLKGASEFLETVGGGIGYQTSKNVTPQSITANIIRTVLSFLGIIFLILIITGGYQWMTAGGNEETIGKAKKRIINATIGLVIVLAAYAITYFIIYNLTSQTINPNVQVQ